MRITALRVNHLDKPMGYWMDRPTISWITEEAEGTVQKAASVVVGKDCGLREVVWDSGKREEISSLGVTLDIALSPRTRYYYQVQVWDDAGDHGVSETAWFETGKREEPWLAQWVTPSFGNDVHPLIRKSFHIPGPVRSARAYVSGLGLYELEINGKKAGDEYLAPFCNDYNEWVQYQTMDITPLLVEGDNAVGAMLGNGWFKGRFGFIDGLDKIYGDRFALICEIVISLEDGREIVLGTDESWDCHPSAVTASSIYDGESYDANLEIPNWSAAACDTRAFQKVKKVPLNPLPWGPLRERLSPPVVITERLKPYRLIHTPANEQVLDFGQVLTGWMAFGCDLPKDAQVHIQFGELLQEGNFYNDNLRSAKAEYIYTSKGERALVRPHFTFYGFRYAKISGMDTVCPEDFTACVLHSDLERTGFIRTSNEKINRLFANALWSQKGNFLDIPTDCPQRDERMGWTGDAQAFCGTAAFNMHTPAFFAKYLRDMLFEQRNLGGSVPFVVPDVLGEIAKIAPNTPNEIKTPHGSSVWGDAATIIPWTQYLFYGDKALLEEQFENMTAWTDYIHRIDEEHCGGKRLWEHGFHFGDWLALDNPDKNSPFGGTPSPYIASAFYFYAATLTAKAAEALSRFQDEDQDRDQDATKAAVYEKAKEKYRNLAQEIRTALQHRYFPDGDLTEDTQTAMVLALHMDFVPEGQKDKLVARLKRKLDERDIHLDTGFVGTSYLCSVLSNNGLSDYAYTLLLNEDFPSWLYEVNLGATTIWERWNSVLPDGTVSDTGMNSMNHYAYGSIVEWMYRVMCGINPTESKPGFKEAVISPLPDRRFGWIESEYLSASGLYTSAWRYEGDRIHFEVTVPFDAEAIFILPAGAKQVTFNGPATDLIAGQDAIRLKAGSYQISCEAPS